jgi:arylsulfatase A
MKRRDFIRTCGAGLAALACPHAARAQGTAGKLPNIVLILADDMGFGDVACQNPDSKVPAPNLDRLAREGVRLSDCHSASAVCTPARYSILTGRYCWRTVLKQSVLWPWDGPLIATDRLTLPGMLKTKGYNTACIGKWHLGWDWPAKDGSSINDTLPPGVWNKEARNPFAEKIDFSRQIGGGPVTRGFDYYFGDDVPNFPPYTFIENDRVQALPRKEKPAGMFGAPGPMAEGWDLEAVMPAITEKAEAFIRAKTDEAPFEKQADAPFFLYFPLTAPHTPIAPADAFKGRSGAGRYGDYVCQVDAAAGRIMKALEDTGQAENTLLIFTSDNGSPARDGENMAGKPRSVLKYGHNPSHIYRGIKADIWEGGHRIPFIARWPGRIPAGSVRDALAGQIDIMATVAEITGCDLPENAAEDSLSMLPMLTGETSAPVREALVHHSIHGMFAIRDQRWKLILGRGAGGWSGKGDENDPPGQLYDMQKDPEEKENLYNERPKVAARLKNLLEKWQQEGRSVSRS